MVGRVVEFMLSFCLDGSRVYVFFGLVLGLVALFSVDLGVWFEEVW